MEMLIPYQRTSAEMSLLLRLMQGEAKLSAEIDRERLQAMIRKNRLEPMAAERLDGAECLELAADEAALTTMRQISLLGHLARLFAQQGIRVLSVKGPALSMEIYGTPGMRSNHDLDLLVERQNVDQAVELLVQDGWTWYERDVLTTRKRRAESLHLQNHYLFTKGEMCVELHWRLLPWDCDVFEHLWASRRQVMLGGAEIAVPGVVHQLHHLVYHGVRHGFHRMKWLADLAVLLPRHVVDMDDLWHSLAKCGQDMTLVLTWVLLLSLRELVIPNVSFGGVTLKRTNSGVLASGTGKAENVLQQVRKLLDTLMPLLESEKDIEYTAPYYEYRDLLPVKLGYYMKRMMNRLRPRAIVWRWIDLPDSLYWLYWPLRPLEKVWRLLKGKSAAKKY